MTKFKELFEASVGKSKVGSHWVRDNKKSNKSKSIEFISVDGRSAEVKDETGKTSTLSLDYILKNFSEI